MVRFYELHGFPSAAVRVEAADTDRPENVILSIEIWPGRPPSSSRSGSSWAIRPAAPRWANLENEYKVDAGARVDEPSFAEADRELAEGLKQHGFFRAEVRHAISNVGAFSYLYVYLYPGPRMIPRSTATAPSTRSSSATRSTCRRGPTRARASSSTGSARST